MNAKHSAPHKSRHLSFATRTGHLIRGGFTLVELLVVITIIAILAGLAIPAIRGAMDTASNSAIRMEATSLSEAIEQYQQKYGDYPPDFSDWAVVQRHYRKLFPRMSANDLGLLSNMLHTLTGGLYNPAQLDRSEVLPFVLGGYSDDIQRPLTGPGGPFVWVGNGTNSYTDATVTDANRQNPGNFQINSDRVNSLHDFETSRLSLGTVNSSAPLTGANRYLSTDDGDLFLSYASVDEGGPFVYFDSRSYTHFDPNVQNVANGSGDFNGYGSASFGFVRPYVSTESVNNATGANYASVAAAQNAWRFIKPDTFQLIAPGLDGSFGNVTSVEVDGSNTFPEPVYFQYPTGNAVVPQTTTDNPQGLLANGVSKFQDASFPNTPSESGQTDNLANFADSKLADDVPDK